MRFRGTQAGHIISAILSLFFCLVGLYVRYGMMVYELNRELQPSLQDILDLMPEAMSNPMEISGVAVHHVSILIGTVIGFLLNSKIRRMS